MNNKNLLIILILILSVSACCKKKKCTDIETSFTESEKNWIKFDPTTTINNSNLNFNDTLILFTNSQNATDTFFINSSVDGPYKDMCEGPSCCNKYKCKEDDRLYGALYYTLSVNGSVLSGGSSVDDLMKFNVNIDKTRTSLNKKFTVNAFTFSDFDSTYTNMTINNKLYDTVFVKTTDTSLYNPVCKIWFSKKQGLVKYQLTQNRIWERSN